MPTLILPLLTALAIAWWGILWYRNVPMERGQLSMSQVKARLRSEALVPVTPPSSPSLPKGGIDDFDESFDMTVDGNRRPLIVEDKPVVNSAALILDDGVVAVPTAEETQNLMGYCVRCRTKRFLAKPELTTTRQGRPAVRGECAICGAEMLVFAMTKIND